MSQDHWFTCPHCAVRYNWLPQQAGRKVRCRCMAMMRIPSQPNETALLLEPVETSLTKKTSSPTEPSSTAGFVLQLESHDASIAPLPCHGCGRMLRTSDTLCTACGAKLQTSRAEPAAAVVSDDSSRVAMLVEDAEPVLDKVSRSEHVVKSQMQQIESRFAYDRQVEHQVTTTAMIVEVVLPIVLTLAGLVMLMVELFFYHPMIFQGLDHPHLARALMHGFNVGVAFVFFALGVLLVARLFGHAPGTLGKLLLKLTAISVFCVATDAMFHWGLDVITEGHAALGGYLKLIVSGVVFFSVAGVLMGLDILELVVLFIFSRLVPTMMLMFMATIIYSLFD